MSEFVAGQRDFPHDSVLGVDAVLQHERFVAAQLERNHVRPPAQTERYGYQNELVFVRHQLDQMGERQKEQFARALFKAGLPLLLGEQAAVAGTRKASLIEWLSEEPAVYARPAERNRYDNRVLNFVQWHVDRLALKNSDPATLALIERKKRSYQKAIHEAVSHEYLPLETVASVERIDDLSITIGDSFFSIVEDSQAHWVTGTNKIVISQGEQGTAASDRRAVKEHLFHELNHALLPGFSQRWLNEACAEHLALILEGAVSVDMLDVVGEDVPLAAMTTYSGERVLLDVVLHHGKDEIPVELVLQAYASQLRHPARQQLREAIDHSWGQQGMLAQLHQQVRFEERKMIAQNPGLHRATIYEMAMSRVEVRLRRLATKQRKTA